MMNVFLSAAVIAAAVGAIANVIISIINNRRLKLLEKDKKATELQRFRYTELCGFVKAWLTPKDRAPEIDLNVIFRNELIANIGRYKSIRFLLDKEFKDILDPMLVEAECLLNALIPLVKNMNSSDYKETCIKISAISTKFTSDLHAQVCHQLEKLLLEEVNQ